MLKCVIEPLGGQKMSYDPNMPPERWQSLPLEQNREIRIQVRAYFLWKNGFPGSDLDRNAVAEFEDRFYRWFWQTEKTLGYDYINRQTKLRLKVVRHLIGVLRLEPQKIEDATPLKIDPQYWFYFARRIEYETCNEFPFWQLVNCPTVGDLLNLLGDQERERLKAVADLIAN